MTDSHDQPEPQKKNVLFAVVKSVAVSSMAVLGGGYSIMVGLERLETGKWNWKPIAAKDFKDLKFKEVMGSLDTITKVGLAATVATIINDAWRAYGKTRDHNAAIDRCYTKRLEQSREGTDTEKARG